MAMAAFLFEELNSMEARNILQNLRENGLKVKSNGNLIDLNPKRLVTEQIVSSVKKHKVILLTILHQEKDQVVADHLKRKNKICPGRIHVLKVILENYFEAANPEALKSNSNAPDELLNKLLRKFNYNIEDAIDYCRDNLPEKEVKSYLCKCGLNPPFCKCNTKLTDREKLWNILKSLAVLYECEDSLNELWNSYQILCERYKDDLYRVIDFFTSKEFFERNI